MLLYLEEMTLGQNPLKMVRTVTCWSQQTVSVWFEVDVAEELALLLLRCGGGLQRLVGKLCCDSECSSSTLEQRLSAPCTSCTPVSSLFCLGACRALMRPFGLCPWTRTTTWNAIAVR